MSFDDMADSLSLISVELSSSHTVTLAQLVDGWGLDVARFLSEASAHEMSHKWGAHDYFAALHLRGIAENASLGAGRDAQQFSRDRLEPHDRVLIDFTEHDHRRLVREFANMQTEWGWWWDRIPRSGLVREELERWNAALARE